MKLMKFVDFHARYSPQLSQAALATYIDICLTFLNGELIALTRDKNRNQVIYSYFKLKSICKIANVSIVKATKIRDELIEAGLIEKFYPYNNKIFNYIIKIIPVSLMFDVFMEYVPMETLVNIVKNGIPVNEFFFLIIYVKNERSKKPLQEGESL